MIYLKSSSGHPGGRLNAVAKWCWDAGPQSIPHSGPTASGDDFLRVETRKPRWASHFRDRGRGQGHAARQHYGAFQGTAKVFEDSMKNMGILLIVRDRGGLHRARHVV